MKSASLKVLSLTLISFVCSCQKAEESAENENDKIAAISCPRVAAIKENKAEPIYKVTTYAGANEFVYDLVDGVLCKARFYEPQGLAYDGVGSFYVIENGHNNIRKISLEGVVSTYAGSSEGGDFTDGFKDGVGTESRFDTQKKNVFLPDGNMVVIDQGGKALRKVTPTAEVTTLLKIDETNVGYVDGALSEAKFGPLVSIAVTADGSNYFIDWHQTIRKISPDNIVSTYAGRKPITGIPVIGYQDGPKETARFAEISDITFDSSSNLYINDKGNKKLRRITPEGQVETVADLDAEFLATDSEGNVYATAKTKIFKITPSGAVTTIAGSDASAHKDAIGSAARFTDVKRIIVKDNYLYIVDGFTIRRMAIK